MKCINDYIIKRGVQIYQINAELPCWKELELKFYNYQQGKKSQNLVINHANIEATNTALIVPLGPAVYKQCD